MLTDEETRVLLHGAAETIEVRARAVVPPARRTWPVLVAAAAAVAVVAVGVGVALRPDGTAPPPPGDSTTSATVDREVDPYAGDPAFHLGPDQVPSVEGLSAEVAVRKLTEAGFKVEVRDEPSCAAGRALGTDPGLGTLAEAGTTVTVLRGDDSGSNCLISPDFGLLDFLTGTGPAPLFADEVRIYQDFDDATVLSGADAADLASWPRRDVITRLLDTVAYDAGGFHPVSIRVGDDPDDFSCGDQEPVGVTGGGQAFVLTPWHLHGRRPGPCVDLGIYRDATGAITAVQVDAKDDTGAPPFAFPPSVLGNSESFAHLRVEAAGYEADFVDITDCAPVGIVSRMAGAVDFYPGDTLVLGVTTRTGACAPDEWSAPTSYPAGDADAVGDSFVTFAEGGPQPPWAEEVTLYIADITMRTLSRPGDRTEWGLCLSPDAMPLGRSCLSGNVLDLVADQPLTIGDGFVTDPCLFHSPDSPNDFKIPAATLRGPGECGFAVELWTNEEGQISGVNYLYSRDELLPPRCTPGDGVRMSDGGRDGAMRTVLQYWDLTAERPCTLRGYPTATLYDDAGAPLDYQVNRSGRDVETVLVGGDLEPSIVLGISLCDVTPDAGRSASVRIDLPGDAGVLSADAVFPHCPEESQQLLIDPIRSWR